MHLLALGTCGLGRRKERCYTISLQNYGENSTKKGDDTIGPKQRIGRNEPEPNCAGGGARQAGATGAGQREEPDLSVQSGKSREIWRENLGWAGQA